MKNEDLVYIKETIVWMIENMELKDSQSYDTETLYSRSMNSVTSLNNEIFLNNHKCEPVSYKGKYSHCKHCGMTLQLKR